MCVLHVNKSACWVERLRKQALKQWDGFKTSEVLAQKKLAYMTKTSPEQEAAKTVLYITCWAKCNFPAPIRNVIVIIIVIVMLLLNKNVILRA